MKVNLDLKFKLLALFVIFELQAMDTEMTWSPESTTPGGCPDGLRLLFARNNYNFRVLLPDGRMISDTDLDSLRLARLGVPLERSAGRVSAAELQEIRKQHRMATQQMVRDRQRAAALMPDPIEDRSPPGGE